MAYLTDNPGSEKPAGTGRLQSPSSSRGLLDNPLLSHESIIPFESMRPEHITPAVRELIRQGREDLAAIATLEEQRTFENTVLPIDRLGLKLSEVWRLVKNLHCTINNPELNTAVTEVESEQSRFFSEIKLSQNLWHALKDYASSQEARQLDPLRKRVLDRMLSEFRLAGADLPGDLRERLIEIRAAVSQLESVFKNNLDRTFEKVEILLEHAPAGVPEIALESARAQAAERGYPGKYFFGADAPSYDSILRFAEDPVLRERMYTAFHSCAFGGEFDNVKVAGEILALRREMAGILKQAGFAGRSFFADFQLALRMAGSGDCARSMMSRIAEAARLQFESETAEILSLKREMTGDDSAALSPWDVSYYAETLRSRRFGFRESQVMEYLPLEKALTGLFEISHRLYGLKIEPSDSLPVWHPDVKAFDIFTAGGKHHGSFYFDPYARPGSKNDGAWMETLRRVMPGVVDHQQFIGMLACNFSPPSGDRPVLLKHAELETLFHEFGHLMHAACVEAPFVCLSDMPWDAVELPSQLIENWIWDREILKSLSSHYIRSAEQLPSELIEKMLGARSFRQASDTFVRLAGFSLLDLSLHMEYEPQEHGDLIDYSRRFLSPFMPAEVPPYGTRVQRFTHLFAGEYAAGYYSYLWALVLACDEYEMFKKEGFLNPETGKRHRETVLKHGDAVDILHAHNQFMGRPPETPPDIGALFRVYGLTHS